mgnify:CR=1 FL=1
MVQKVDAETTSGKDPVMGVDKVGGDGIVEGIKIGRAVFTDMSVESYNHSFTYGDITYVMLRDPNLGVYFLFMGSCNGPRCTLSKMVEFGNLPEGDTVRARAIPKMVSGQTAGVPFSKWEPIIDSDMETAIREDVPRIVAEIMEAEAKAAKEP